jgi:hypothetical protein
MKKPSSRTLPVDGQGKYNTMLTVNSVSSKRKKIIVSRAELWRRRLGRLTAGSLALVHRLVLLARPLPNTTLGRLAALNRTTDEALAADVAIIARRKAGLDERSPNPAAEKATATWTALAGEERSRISKTAAAKRSGRPT